MSDNEQKTPNKTGASGAAWTEAEKITYLIILCENEGKIESKIASAPIPAGRSIVSCKKLLWRLKEKYKDDIEKMKNGQPVTVAAGADGEATATATPEKPKTPRKRKAKAEGESEGNGDAEGSPKKKAGGRKKKANVAVREEVKEEQAEDEAMI